ncbi:MAG: penicillin-binding transpeptidase domain-containing protein, partial [Actinoplanes sp.]
RQVYVLDAMVKAQMITQEQRDEAVAEKLTFAGRTPPNGCVDASGATDGWGFFCDYLRRWWQAQPQFGATAEERDNALRRGGYTVVTTLDPEVQKTAAAQARAVYSIKSDKVLPIAAVQPGTGKVLALAVNRKYGTGTAAGETVNPLISGGSGLHGYQAGSTFKMFTMLAALEAGLPLDTGFTSPSRLPTRWSDSGPESCNGQWCPANANPSWMDGDRTMWNGFGRSVNTYFVQLEEQIGPAAVVAMAQKLGISLSAPSDAAMARDNADAWGSFTLGVAATTPLELASAYAAVAAEGTYCAPLPVASITGPDGAKVPVASNCQRVISEDVARAATDAARCPVGQQSSFRRCDGGTAEQVDRIMGGRPVAGKTGSTDDNSTETFAGFTRSVAAAGIAADPTNPANHVGSAVQREVINAVARTIRTATGGEPYGNFVAPSRQVALGE